MIKIEKKEKGIRKHHSIYFADNEWRNLEKFALILGYKKTGEFIRESAIKIMQNPELQKVFDDGDLFKKDMIKEFYRNKLHTEVDELLELIDQHGILLPGQKDNE